MSINKGAIIAENKRRVRALFCEYDPILGIGSPIPRLKFEFFDRKVTTTWYIPEKMMEEPLVKYLNGADINDVAVTVNMNVAKIVLELMHIRFRYDFEFWAATCAKIQHKRKKKEVSFILNYGQRKLLKELESMRNAGVPIRIILLKARQWGGSTLVQMYMGWMQLILKTNWHSAIVTQFEPQAKNIRGMYNKMIKAYPKMFCESVTGTDKITLLPYEGSSKIRFVAGRGNIIGVGSAEEPDSLRSFDFAMLHISELGLWRATAMKTPQDLAQSLMSTVPEEPDTLIVKESTAKGVGNFFHNEWLAAVEGKSADRPVFVAWFEIEQNSSAIKNYNEFISTMTDYDWYQWECGATLEGIKWYKGYKSANNFDDWRMMSENPTTAIEAFQSTGRRAFAPIYVSRARKFNIDPEFVGDVFADSVRGKNALENISFHKTSNGELSIWAMPDKTQNISNRYVVPVDIGGRTHTADYSIIRVFDRYGMMDGGVPEAILTWKGHLDQDLVTWKAVQIAKAYNNALLVPECNSLDTEDSEGDHFLTILDEISDHYENIFSRTDPEKVRQGLPIKYGFHTNKKTKPELINNMNAALRDLAYIEYDKRVLDEADCYEIKPNGTYGAVDGSHDDILMSTAIGLWVCTNSLDIPKLIIPSSTAPKNKLVSESSF